MILIGENIHIISKRVREALENKDENFVKNLIKLQQNVDCIDLNIGPAKGKLDKVFEWLVPIVGNKPISFDSSNIDAISRGLSLKKDTSDCFINSTTNDIDPIERLSKLSLDYNSNLIALAMSKKDGIKNTADERFEVVMDLYEKLSSCGIDENKMFFDPLVLPVKVAQNQAIESLNTIRMINESFENAGTVIGLSNISNGIPLEYRSMVNRVYLAMAYGAGLKSAIVDAKDIELIKLCEILDKNVPSNEIEQLYLDIVNMIKNFGEVEDIVFDKNSIEAQNVIKTVKILLNKNIYSDNFTRV